MKKLEIKCSQDLLNVANEAESACNQPQRIVELKSIVQNTKEERSKTEPKQPMVQQLIVGRSSCNGSRKGVKINTPPIARRLPQHVCCSRDLSPYLCSTACSDARNIHSSKSRSTVIHTNAHIHAHVHVYPAGKRKLIRSINCAGVGEITRCHF